MFHATSPHHHSAHRCFPRPLDVERGCRVFIRYNGGRVGLMEVEYLRYSHSIRLKNIVKEQNMIGQ